MVRQGTAHIHIPRDPAGHPRVPRVIHGCHGSYRGTAGHPRVPRVIHGCLWSSTGAAGHPRVPQVINGSCRRLSTGTSGHPRVLRVIHGYRRSSTGATGHPRVPQVIHGYHGSSTGTAGHPRVPRDIHGFLGLLCSDDDLPPGARSNARPGQRAAARDRWTSMAYGRGRDQTRRNSANWQYRQLMPSRRI